jgi:predicted RNase H-like HicB family nuclease
MKNSLKELLQLNYKVEIEKIPDSEGGGYCASIPLLGKNACRGDGDTVEEAYESLDSIKEYLFKKWLSEGTNIPVPLNDNIEDVSGKFLLRLPKELHYDLHRRAKENETTLNQYCVYLLSQSFVFEKIETCIQRRKQNGISELS